MSKLSKKKVIGITGSMGSGKSEISRYLRKKYPDAIKKLTVSQRGTYLCPNCQKRK